MTSARVSRGAPRQQGSTRPLAFSGVPFVVAGALYWASDASPTRGAALLVLGLAIVVAGLVMPGPTHGALLLVVVAAIVVTLWGCYETWRAIEAIMAQGSPHLAVIRRT